MTTRSRLLSVRVDSALAEALERHCEAAGITRSRVVQQSVAQYLVDRTAPSLAALAEAVLPPVPARPGRKSARARQQRFRDRMREKRRR